ncbi:MAG: hypothetical protein IH960_00200 [Chloroflexi bacterium]|nr:hypothetical protein [Chloroflexota bacterium]
MQTSSQIQVDQTQLGALENGCGLVFWDSATIVRHSGPDALDLLHRLTTKELLSLTEGRARRTVLTSARGRVVDVFLVAHVSEDHLLLISDSDNSERMISAIDRYTIIEDAELTDLSGSNARISLIGPRAVKVVESVLGEVVGSDASVTAEFDSESLTIVSDTSRGVGWLDAICPVDVARDLAVAFESAGAVAVDPDNFELFRITRGIPGSDREYGEHANPIESGLFDLIDFDKGCYVGQEVIARLDTYDKVKRNLKVLECEEPIEAGMTLQLPVDSKSAGIITSASPLMTEDGVYLGLGLVRKAFLATGTVLDSGGIAVRVR